MKTHSTIIAPGTYSYRRLSAATEAAKATSLRIATFNVECAPNPERIAEAINANDNLRNADILLLQEIECHGHEKKPRAETIAELTGFDCLYAPARHAGKDGTHGLAILSKRALGDIRLMPLMFQNLVFRSRERIGIACTIEIGKELVKIYNIHLDTRINAAERLRQMKPVLEDMLHTPTDKVIVAGDFNTVPIRWIKNVIPIWYAGQRKTFDHFLGCLGFENHAPQNGCTMRRGAVRFRLDSIYARGFERSASGIENGVDVSDHLPLWADLKLDSFIGA